ncbi:hypothetical protein ACA910_022753 [Epithemia clementina (nom. ined.)]
MNNAAGDTPLVFLCHTGADELSNKPFVKEVNRQLREIGINTFFDEQSIEDGDFLSDRIHRAILETKIAVVFFSEAFFGQKWPRDEFREFYERRMKNETCIFPVLIDLTHERYEFHLQEHDWRDVARIKYHKALPPQRAFRAEKVKEAIKSFYKKFDTPFASLANLTQHDTFQTLCMLPDVAPLTHGDRHIIGEEAVEQELNDE